MDKIINSTYEIIEKIGSGGGGIVYLARHLRLNKQVVLKADKRKITTRQEILRREVDVLKDLSHTNIPQVYDFFIEGNIVYTVMDFVQGESLDKPLKRGETYSQSQVIKWAIQLLEALNYLHSPTHGSPPRGYVHSDIKPANIMRKPNGDVCLIDFNIALALGEKNVAGYSVGYASPEHYGIDYSFDKMGDLERTSTNHPIKRTINNEKKNSSLQQSEIRLENEVKMPSSTVLEEQETITDNKVEFIKRGIGYETIIDSSAQLAVTSIGNDGYRKQLIQDDVATLVDSVSNLPSTILENSGVSTSEEQTVKEVSEIKEQSCTSKSVKKIIPDARSDIYSLGATLYHLLSGVRPDSDACNVIPLSTEKFNPQIVAIITKAMQPNPELRYQTAEEMLYDFLYLRNKDSRVIHEKKRFRIVTVISLVMLIVGLFVMFVGMRRMQISEQWLKLAGYSSDAIHKGDPEKALKYAMQAMPSSQNVFNPAIKPETQKALTDALGVYNLTDGFYADQLLTIDSKPYFMEMSPEGTKLAVICSGQLQVYDLDLKIQLASLPAEDSALSKARFLSEDTLVFAGKDGLQEYDLYNKKVLWSGSKATSIVISDDMSTIATVYKDDTKAYIYNSNTGELLKIVKFSERHQDVAYNDLFADPDINLFELSENGEWLAVSFSDGSVELYNTRKEDMSIELVTSGEGNCFHGGFFRQYFAFSVGTSSKTMFTVINLEKKEETFGFNLDSSCDVQVDNSGIYLGSGKNWVEVNPETGEQMPVAYAISTVNIFTRSSTGTFSVVSDQENVCTIFTKDAIELQKISNENKVDFICVSDRYLCIASMDSLDIQVLRFEDYSDLTIAEYDPSIYHTEARIDMETGKVMLYNVNSFTILELDGKVIAEVQLHNSDQIYDQQFLRNDDGCILEVTWYNGNVEGYSAVDASLVYSKQIELQDYTLYEELYTENYKVKSPLKGTPVVYDTQSGDKIAELETDDYLTYIKEIGDYILTEYMTADGFRYGLLLNKDFKELAYLPELCDALYINKSPQNASKGDVVLIFDTGVGSLRQSKVYSVEELQHLGAESLGQK